MPLTQRRGSAQRAHNNTYAASTAAVSFLIGGSALNEACDILASASCQQSETQHTNNEDHSQKLAALYQKGKAAYNIICRADDASAALSSSDNIMPIMTPGNLAATSSSSACNSSQSSLTAAANNTPLPRSRGSFSLTPHGNKTKMTPGLIHRKRSSMEGGGRVVCRSLSDTSDVSNNNNSSTPGHGNNNTNRGGGGKSATNASTAKKQQQKTNKADPPPEVLNFLKALNAGGSTAGSTSSTPPSSSLTTSAAATNNNDDDDNTTNNSRKRPSASYGPNHSTKKRPPPPPPRRQTSRSSTDAGDEEHDKSNNNEDTTTTKRTRSKRRGTSSTNDNNTRVYDIGESVFVQVDGKHYNAIVKNVDFKPDEDDPEDVGDDNDYATKQVRAVYEVEFSDGEVLEDVGGDDVHSADEEE